ncbi:MAG TPA: hypothetical protein VF177_20215 [Anaerolineae bacterium]
MNEVHQILERDLTILEEMVAEIGGYLMSEATHWIMARGDMPKLTIGGCLMRQHRLSIVRDQLEPAEQVRLDTVLERFEEALKEKVVRFEDKGHQELHARLSEWSGYLRDMTSRMVTEPEYYASVVDTRVVVTALLNKLRLPPYELNPHILDEVDQLDGYLRSRWQSGEFVWPAVWQPAYPPEEYWWLYGRPR